MITMIDGRLRSAVGGFAEVETRMGLTFRIRTHRRLVSSLPSCGTSVSIPTELLFSQVGPAIYGFAEERERGIFSLLQTAPGVGARLAHAILGHFEIDRLIAIIASGDAPALAAAPGIGKKKAERIVQELESSIAVWLPESAAGESRRDIEQALVGLGFLASSVSDAISSALSEDKDMADADLMKRALKLLAATRQ